MHNLNIREDGQANMFYTGAAPWHNLGTKVDHALTAAEAIEAAGMNWSVAKEPVLRNGGIVPGHNFSIRQDTNAVLGIVGGRYVPLQNKEAFSFFDAVVGEKLAIYHTAGVLGLGERVWILAKLPGYITVKGIDPVGKFLLLTNTHDGSGSVQMMFCATRVVCQNTLNVALGEDTVSAKLRHTASIGIRVNSVRQQLGIMLNKFSVLEQVADSLASVELNARRLDVLLGDSGIKTTDSGQMSTRQKNIIQDVIQRIEHGKGNDMPGIRNTLWSAVNGIVEYADYAMTVKSNSPNKTDARVKSLLFGSAAMLKQRAFDSAIRLARGSL